MDKSEKKVKRALISKFFDLANGRFKDHEINVLADIVQNLKKYDGLSKTFTKYVTDWGSDGKYHRIVKDTYTFAIEMGKAVIKHHTEYIDDGKLSFSWDKKYTTAREILKYIGRIIN